MWRNELHSPHLINVAIIQFSLVISCCNVTFSVFWISQGSVATVIRWGGWRSYHYMCRSFINLTVKTALKFINFWRSYRWKWWLLFMAHGLFIGLHRSARLVSIEITKTVESNAQFSVSVNSRTLSWNVFTSEQTDISQRWYFFFLWPP